MDNVACAGHSVEVVVVRVGDFLCGGRDALLGFADVFVGPGFLLEPEVVDDLVEVVVADVALGVEVVEVTVALENRAPVGAGYVVFDAEGVEALEEVFSRADEDACVGLDERLLVRVERYEVLVTEEQPL